MKNEIKLRILSSTILLPITFYLIILDSFYFKIFLLICYFISLYEWFKMKKNIVLNYFGLFFLTFSFYTVLKLMNLYGSQLYFFSIILICIATDIGGYIFGKLIKGPKLTRISPNKTYAGLVGGLLLSLITIYFFSKFNYFFKYNNFNYNFWIFTILISFISQLGDIIISYFKRLSKIKNSGRIIPGHGGLLDRIDGMIFAFPFSYILSKYAILQFIQ